MTSTKPLIKIDFKPIALGDKALYEAYLFDEEGRGCEFSFANLYLWGRQSYALLFGDLVLLAEFNGRFSYPYPFGKGNKKKVLDAIIADAEARGIPCRITGLSPAAKETLDSLYPDAFRFEYDEGSFDYVYQIEDLAELKGKKYHGKRNHLNRFMAAYPHYIALPIGEDDLARVGEMTAAWYREKEAQSPESNFEMEKCALDRALRHYRELCLEGLMLLDGDEVLAFTVGSRLSPDTFDVHFEKARPDADGAYAAINYEFARYIREKYPNVRFLDREEDMGLLGLRKAKQSYHPHHRVEKYRAYRKEDTL